MRMIQKLILLNQGTNTSISHQITQVKCLLSAPMLSPAPNTGHTPPTQNMTEQDVIPRVFLHMKMSFCYPISTCQHCQKTPFHRNLLDSFHAAEHPNSSLSALQYVTYLQSQPYGNAAKVISGLTLTSTSYKHSITLVKDKSKNLHVLMCKRSHQDQQIPITA